MPGSVVNRKTELLKIGELGQFIEFDTSEGEDVGLTVTLIAGAWGSASLSLKKAVGNGPPQAFGTAINVTGDYNKQDIDTESASRVVLAVDTKSSTTESFVMVEFVCKGDRISTTISKAEMAFQSPALNESLTGSSDFGSGGAFGP